MKDVMDRMLESINSFRKDNKGLDPNVIRVNEGDLKELLRSYCYSDALDTQNLYFFGKRILRRKGELSVCRISNLNDYNETFSAIDW